MVSFVHPGKNSLVSFGSGVFCPTFTFLSTLLLASVHIYYVGCGNTGMFCRSAPLFCYPNRKNLAYKLLFFLLCGL